MLSEWQNFIEPEYEEIFDLIPEDFLEPLTELSLFVPQTK